MPGVDFRMIRTAVSMRQVLELVKFVPSEVQGDQLRGPCPIHGSTSAGSRSFSANLNKNTFRCFSCGRQGNQLDLWVAVTDQTLHEAAIDLCEKLQVTIPTIRPR